VAPEEQAGDPLLHPLRRHPGYRPDAQRRFETGGRAASRRGRGCRRRAPATSETDRRLLRSNACRRFMARSSRQGGRLAASGRMSRPGPGEARRVGLGQAFGPDVPALLSPPLRRVFGCRTVSRRRTGTGKNSNQASQFPIPPASTRSFRRPGPTAGPAPQAAPPFRDVPSHGRQISKDGTARR
jgi:hypothetical protein